MLFAGTATGTATTRKQLTKYKKQLQENKDKNSTNKNFNAK